MGKKILGVSIRDGPLMSLDFISGRDPVLDPPGSSNLLGRKFSAPNPVVDRPYHQLRAFLAEVSGKKHLTGRTDLDVAISNECGRLIANVVIAYNSILLSMLLNRRQTAEKEKFLELLKKISPVAWQHIHSRATTSFATTATQSTWRPF